MYIQQNNRRKNSPQITTVSRSRSEILISNHNSSYKQLKSQFRKRSLKVKNIRLDECIDAHAEKTLENAVQLKFLADIVKRKQQSTQMASSQELQTVKPVESYHYYDSIVRNLISQIRNRSIKEPVYSNVVTKQVKFTSQTLREHSPKKQGSPLIKISAQRTKMVFSLSLSGSDTVYERKITSLIQFLYKINFSNCIYSDLSLSQPKTTTYKVRVGPGNNGLLVKSLLKRRFWLELVTQADCNFTWTQLTDQIIHDFQASTDKKHQTIKDKPTSKKSKLLISSPQEHLRKILRKEEVLLTNEWY